MVSSDILRAQVRSLVDLEPMMRDGVDGELERLCRAVARALPAAGAGISVITAGGARGITVASDADFALVEELQFTLGEGPCVEALATRRPALASDLTSGGEKRWPAYVSASRQRGIHAVFAFPLQIGAARVGALDVYRTTAGPLTDEAFTFGFTFAQIALDMILDGQQNSAAPTVTAPAVYQAQGMLQVQLGVDSLEAMTRLRAYAYAHELSLVDLSRDVVRRRVVFRSDMP